MRGRQSASGLQVQAAYEWFTSGSQVVHECKRCANFEKRAAISTTSCATLRRVALRDQLNSVESLACTVIALRATFRPTTRHAEQ